MLVYNQLKPRQRAKRDNYPHNLSLRLKRALSWLKLAESRQNDLDDQSIFPQSAFGVAYAK
jgi:hypothetical protein